MVDWVWKTRKTPAADGSFLIRFGFLNTDYFLIEKIEVIQKPSWKILMEISLRV
jgi:hypothetical protein